MPRFHADLWLLMAPCLSAGCTFEPGAPWGEIRRASLAVAFPVSEPRLTADGWLRTSTNYDVQVIAIAPSYHALSVEMQPAAGGAGFDPGAPPVGCTLCHSGHCHCGNELVSYEDLEAKVGQTSSAQGPSIVLAALGAAPLLQLQAPATAIPLAACAPAEACWLPRGALRRVRAALDGLDLDLVVRDQLQGADIRLAQPLPVVVAVPLSAICDAPVEGALERDEPPGLSVAATHTLPESLLDGVDWAALATLDPAQLGAVLATPLTQRLTAVGALSASLDREE